MIEEQGRVSRVERDFAWVEASGSACNHCDQGGGCGAGSWARMLGARRRDLRVKNTLGVAPGEEVVLGLSERALLRGSLLVYGLPVLGLLLGAALGEAVAHRLMWENESAPLVGGVLGLLFALGVARRRLQALSQTGGYQPVLLRRVLENQLFSGIRNG